MYRLARNLVSEKNEQNQYLLQPRTNQGIVLGDHVRAMLTKILEENFSENDSDSLTCHLFAYELLDRGILVPSDVADESSYFAEYYPLHISKYGFFDAKTLRLTQLSEQHRVAFFGVPYDDGASRPGCRFGPELLREFSRMVGFRGSLMSLESREEISPSKFACDLGDLQLPHATVERRMDALSKVMQDLPLSCVPFMIGGDHTYTLATVSGLRTKRASKFTVVQFDSHLDLQLWGRFKEDGPDLLDTPAHSNFVSHIKQRFPDIFIHQIGARHYQSIPNNSVGHVKNYLKQVGTQLSDMQCQQRPLWRLIKTFPRNQDVYLSIDVDVLKSVEVAQTGYPNPMGLSFHQLVCLVRNVIAHNNIIGIDVMEFAQTSRRDEHRREAEMLTALLLTILEGLACKWQIS